MNILLRTFNDSINSKTGSPLHPMAPKRGTPEWKLFESILIDTLNSLGHSCTLQLEHPHTPDIPGDFSKRIYVHKCKRDVPQGDLFWMQMHMRELFTIDTNGWGADHSNISFNPGVIDEKEAEEFCLRKSEALRESGLSKCNQPSGCSETPESFILVPIQVPRDYTILHHSPITVRYFVESIQAWAIEHSQQVCFKLHPHNKSDFDLIQTVEEAQASSPWVRKVEGNIHELIRRSSGLFVINSGVGFEALLHGKPVATFGNCDYNKATFNADIRRLGEACDFLLNYKAEWRSIAYKFVYWYYHHHAYNVYAESTPERLRNYLQGALNA